MRNFKGNDARFEKNITGGGITFVFKEDIKFISLNLNKSNSIKICRAIRTIIGLIDDFFQITKLDKILNSGSIINSNNIQKVNSLILKQILQVKLI